MNKHESHNIFFYVNQYSPTLITTPESFKCKMQGRNINGSAFKRYTKTFYHHIIVVTVIKYFFLSLIGTGKPEDGEGYVFGVGRR